MENKPAGLTWHPVQIMLTLLWLSVSLQNFTECLGEHMPVGVERTILGNFDLVIDKMQ